ncbi:hypothetical protein EJ08DRAFT_734953 [Tothia fuscella]|uniref:Uncharacterized protein n=1 Tax=Tothia fuscella TaxID=1048955 RepID=A0A9P4NPQ9_9PEZI|nr:hypothetical protein EJ08DRAFT_734953 [Tothia fuscella]
MAPKSRFDLLVDFDLAPTERRSRDAKLIVPKDCNWYNYTIAENREIRDHIKANNFRFKKDDPLQVARIIFSRELDSNNSFNKDFRRALFNYQLFRLLHQLRQANEFQVSYVHAVEEANGAKAVRAQFEAREAFLQLLAEGDEELRSFNATEKTFFAKKKLENEIEHLKTELAMLSLKDEMEEYIILKEIAAAYMHPEDRKYWVRILTDIEFRKEETPDNDWKEPVTAMEVKLHDKWVKKLSGPWAGTKARQHYPENEWDESHRLFGMSSNVLNMTEAQWAREGYNAKQLSDANCLWGPSTYTDAAGDEKWSGIKARILASFEKAEKDGWEKKLTECNSQLAALPIVSKSEVSTDCNDIMSKLFGNLDLLNDPSAALDALTLED